MSSSKIRRRTFLASGLAAGVSLPGGPVAAATGLLAPRLIRRATVVCGGVDSGRPILGFCHIGPASSMLTPSLRGLLSKYGLAPIVAASMDRLSPGDVARRVATIGHSVPDTLVLLGDCRRPDDLERLVGLVEALQDLRGPDLFVIAALPRSTADAPRIERLVDRCDGVIGLQHAVQGRDLDRALVAAAHSLLDGLYIHGFIGYDHADLFTVMHAAGVFAFGLGRSSHGTLHAADQALLEVERQGIDLSRVCSVHMGFSGDADTTLVEISDLAARVQARISDSAHVMFYATIKQELRGQVEVSLLAAIERRRPLARRGR